jgi:hypothetical protein
VPHSASSVLEKIWIDGVIFLASILFKVKSLVVLGVLAPEYNVLFYDARQLASGEQRTGLANTVLPLVSE